MKLTTLGKPADFSLPITVQELDGTDVQIPFIGIGRTTLEWQPITLARIERESKALLEREEKLEAEKAKATETPKADEAKKPAKRKQFAIPHAEIAKTTEQGFQAAVDSIREVASGWELEDDFTDENIKAAVARFPGLQAKLWQEYDARIKGNRTKN